MKVVCPSCGARYEKGKFCPECGSPLSEVVTKKILFCPSCQTEVPSGKFCPECGTKLEEREIEIGAESNTALPAEEPSSQITEPSVVPEVEAILAKYRDEFGDLRELNKEEYAIAAEEFEKCANQGSLDGMCYLAYLYMGGRGVPEDQAHAYNLLCEAERKGSKYAVAILGLFYLNGIIVEPDGLEALRRFEEGYKNTLIPGLAGIIAHYYIGHEDFGKALRYAQESADKGNKDGFRALGDLYLYGLGVEQNDQLAFENYMQAAAQGEEVALNQIGWMYQNGCGVEADSEQAFFWYNEAAQKGSDIGMANLAFCYQNGYGVEQDAEVAAEWFKKSAEAGNVDSMLELASYYESYFIDFDKQEMWLQKAADLGNAEAQNQLGAIYQFGQSKDLDKAILYYQKAAEQGHVEAMWSLFILYKDYKRDVALSEKWLLKAAECGHESAIKIMEDRKKEEDQKKIDTILDDALSIWEKGTDKANAYKIWEKYANLGNPRAMHNIAGCFITGEFMEKNAEKAEEWLRKIMQTGCEPTNKVLRLTFRLALMYMEGDGTKINIPKFKEWMQIAMNDENRFIDDLLIHRDFYFLRKMATILVDGQLMGAEKNNFINYERGFNLHKQVAYMGDSITMANLGWCYENGRGTEQNIQEALNWYQQALNCGYEKDEWITERIDYCEKQLRAPSAEILKIWYDCDGHKLINVYSHFFVHGLQGKQGKVFFEITGRKNKKYQLSQNVNFSYDHTEWKEYVFQIHDAAGALNLYHNETIDCEITISVFYFSEGTSEILLASSSVKASVWHYFNIFSPSKITIQ